MADGEEDESKYQFFVRGQTEPREKGSQQYTGFGRAHYENGDVYDGEYVEGNRRGRGKYTWKKFGDSYEGQYEENRKHGFGKIVYRSIIGEDDEAGDVDENAPPRGGMYLGYLHEGLRGCAPNKNPDEADSDGTFTYVNGDTYVGQWRAGKKHGRGVYSYAADGSKLMGEWEKGKMTVGKWVFPNGTFYSGKFKYNKPIGRGVWVFPNGNQLTGEYVQKEEEANEEDPGEEEEDPDNPKEKPDPKVTCNFIYGDAVAVHGGLMMVPKVDV